MARNFFFSLSITFLLSCSNSVVWETKDNEIIVEVCGTSESNIQMVVTDGQLEGVNSLQSGKLDGPSFFYDEDGRLNYYENKSGLEDGLSIIEYEEGVLVTNFDEGRKTKATYITEEGVLTSHYHLNRRWLVDADGVIKGVLPFVSAIPISESTDTIEVSVCLGPLPPRLSYFQPTISYILMPDSTTKVYAENLRSHSLSDTLNVRYKILEVDTFYFLYTLNWMDPDGTSRSSKQMLDTVYNGRVLPSYIDI